MMGGSFINDATIVGGNFKEISVLMRAGLWRNSLNSFLLETSLAVLLLQASSIASSFDNFLGIRGHPYFMTHSSILKTLTIVSTIFGNESTFSSSPSSYASFGVLILVDCLGEPFVFLVVTCVTVTSIFFQHDQVFDN
jgi:hypothetical protein